MATKKKTKKTRGSKKKAPSRRRPKARSRRQPSLPGFPDIPEKPEIKIPNMPMWEQIGGDMDASGHGAIIARSDGDALELLEIQPVVEYVGQREAADVGFPFWTREGWYDLSDLDPDREEVKSALRSSGFDQGDQLAWFEDEATPEQRALAIAEALFSYGSGVDEGSSGWSGDLTNSSDEVKWWSGGVETIEDKLADEDDNFRDDVLGWGDIREALEKAVEDMVAESAAQGWSQLDDQTMIDLDEQGYEGNSAWVIAAFGREPSIAVNTELTLAQSFADELGIKSDKHVLIWSEIGTRELESWLEKDGYEVTDRGGDVPETEGYAYADHVIQRAARETEQSEETVRKVAETLDWWQEEIPGSTDGDVTVWAKPVDREENDVEARRRRARSSGHPGARARGAGARRRRGEPGVKLYLQSIYDAPMWTVFSGKPPEKPIAKRYWDLFEVSIGQASFDGIFEQGYEPLQGVALSPQRDDETAPENVGDEQAWLAYLAQGGTLMKVPDEPGNRRNPYYRLIAVERKR